VPSGSTRRPDDHVPQFPAADVAAPAVCTGSGARLANGAATQLPLRSGAQSSRAADPGGDLDPVDGEVALASADPTDEELVVPLVPRQFDEFICTSCYLVHHNSRLADPQRGICTDCAP